MLRQMTQAERDLRRWTEGEEKDLREDETKDPTQTRCFPTSTAPVSGHARAGCAEQSAVHRHTRGIQTPL